MKPAYPEVDHTLTRGELAAPFALSDEVDRIEGPTRLMLDLEETDEGLVFAETDPRTLDTIAVGVLA